MQKSVEHGTQEVAIMPAVDWIQFSLINRLYNIVSKQQ